MLLSITGSTKVHDEKCFSNFEDDFGNILIKEINIPKIAHALIEFLPLIDEHNK